eukprot:TRINITY_DN1910_c0_g2_i1.p1 TRINITY_DN1910_c0_g2~~TRINITY_DN1910_c0_g2_i1.p1  ORF type:complete len:346 (+),score=144.66 TRINITY_DN1910_c0_g2_i1:81-1118(+)
MDFSRSNLQNSICIPIQSSSPANLIQSNSKIIKLNIGGFYYETTIFTLKNQGENFFSKLAEGKIPSEIDDKGNYFIDRNGRYFEPLLDFLRTGQLIVPKELSIEMVRREAEFYCIDISTRSFVPIAVSSGELAPIMIHGLYYWRKGRVLIFENFQAFYWGYTETIPNRYNWTIRENNLILYADDKMNNHGVFDSTLMLHGGEIYWAKQKCDLEKGIKRIGWEKVQFIAQAPPKPNVVYYGMKDTADEIPDFDNALFGNQTISCYPTISGVHYYWKSFPLKKIKYQQFDAFKLKLPSNHKDPKLGKAVYFIISFEKELMFLDKFDNIKFMMYECDDLKDTDIITIQ